jgi:hypothetical protein
MHVQAPPSRVPAEKLNALASAVFGLPGVSPVISVINRETIDLARGLLKEAVSGST